MASGPFVKRNVSLLWLIPVALGLFFATLGLRGIEDGVPVDGDAARHAMNGALIHDWLRSGQWLHPFEFARSYYNQYPAISLPYHPPLFPAIESLFFWILGVNFPAALVAVSTAVFVSAVLLYALIMKTHASPILAFVSVATFYGLYVSQAMAADTMLEFPSLVFALAALYSIRDLPDGYPMSRALAFALFAAMAVWSKQNAIFLGLVPFLYAALAGRWDLLQRGAIWVSTGLFGIAVAALVAISDVAGIAVRNPNWRQFDPVASIVRNTGFYTNALIRGLGPVAAILVLTGLLAALIWYLARRSSGKRDALYAAWVAAAVLPLLLAPPFTGRYLFSIYPPILVLAYAALLRTGALYFRPKGLAFAAAILALASLLLHAQRPLPFLRGPATAAEIAVSQSPSRILYCGEQIGAFAMAVRSRDPERRLMLLRCDKLAQGVTGEIELRDLAAKTGVDVAIVESANRTAWPAQSFHAGPAFRLLASIPMSSSVRNANGELHVYRVEAPAGEVQAKPAIRQKPGGRELHVEFEK